ncbi:MAG TPA: glycosyltransferase [Thermoanaerobaculia bacterium]|nr:glycosyltransferase [Thermoanaerobaculia bacterium]
MSVRPRILLVQPSLQPPGGGNGVAVWLVEALRDDHAITVLAWEEPDVGAINDYYGTSLRASDFEVVVVPLFWRWLRSATRLRLALLQRYVAMRVARRIGERFDLVVSVNNEIDAGRRALQYIHFPWGWWPRPDADLRWVHRIPLLLPLYYRIGAMIAPVSRARIAANRTLVNSDWTGERFRETYGGETETVYPPVTHASPVAPWPQRAGAFVVLGVLERHKRIEEAIAILDALRAKDQRVALHIVGSPHDRAYARTIRRMAEARSDWVTLHVDLPRRELLRLLGSVRYGLHAMEDEHFGIAVAEMARAGCIVFVPRSGGQVEIAGRDPRLTYASRDDAVQKIDAVLRSPALQDELRSHLAAQTRHFSVERFRDQIRAIVAEELAGS